VNRGNCPSAAIREQDRHAVGGSHADGKRWIVSNGDVGLRPGLVSPFVRYKNVCAVDLSHPDKRIGFDP
jgi:hypothetical protein